MISFLLGFVLLVFQVALIARVVVDWVDTLGTGRGGTALGTARRVTHAATEPVVAPVRRFVRPVRMGNVGLDLSVLIVFVLVLIARLVIVPLIPF